MSNQPEARFERLIDEHKDRIFRLCSIYAVSPVEPQDLFQDVIIQIWKSLATFRGDASVGTWMYRIALNVCYGSRRTFEKKNRNTIHLDSIRVEPAEEPADIDRLERFQVLRECISSLNDRDKSIVVLHLEDLPHKEIAMIVGVSENLVAVTMKRIRRTLLKCISQKTE